jgi:hypothetical protein
VHDQMTLTRPDAVVVVEPLAFTLTQTCHVLGIKRSRLYQLLNEQGEEALGSFREGRVRLFDAAAVRNYHQRRLERARRQGATL